MTRIIATLEKRSQSYTKLEQLQTEVKYHITSK